MNKIIAALALAAAGTMAGCAEAPLSRGNEPVEPPAAERQAADLPVVAKAPVPDAAQRARWQHDATLMPTGWPATEVMRRAAEEPLTDAAQRARWRHDATLMPAGWPATEVMLTPDRASPRIDTGRTVAEFGSVTAIDHRDQLSLRRRAASRTVAEHGSVAALDHRDELATSAIPTVERGLQGRREDS
jgi:hypothetical protein